MTGPAISRDAYASSDVAGARKILDRIYGTASQPATIHGCDWQIRLSQVQAGDVATADLDLPLDLSFQITGHGATTGW